MDEKKKRRSTVDLSTMVYGKIPPQARELEETVLGAILLEKGAYTQVAEILNDQCFYVDSHQRIFRAIQSLVSKNEPIDLLTVVEELKCREELDMVGGPWAVTKLTNSVVSTANLDTHCKIVFQKWVQRSVIRVCGEAISSAYEDSIEVFDLIETTSDSIKKITYSIAEKSRVVIADIATEIINDLESKVFHAKNGTEDPKNIKTGIPNWDKLNGSLYPGLYVIGARPGMGKTVHMVECICRMGKKYPIGLINGEMTNKQILTRIGTNLMEIDNGLFKKDGCEIESSEIANVYASMEEAQTLDVKIENSIYIDKICSRIKYWVEEEGVKVVFADVLSKFKVPESKQRYYQTDLQKINYVIECLANCAKDVQVPIILYAHLNRDLYKRTNKEPTLADFKGSGNIEDFGYQLSVLHRPEYYDIAEDEHGESTHQLMYQIVLKHRDGELGRLKHRFLGQYSKLVEWNDSVLDGWKPSPNISF